MSQARRDQGVRYGGVHHGGPAGWHTGLLLRAGMAEIFPGVPVAVMAMAGPTEAGKLVLAGWLAANRRATGWLLRTVLVILVIRLALLNGAY